MAHATASQPASQPASHPLVTTTTTTTTKAGLTSDPSGCGWQARHHLVMCAGTHSSCRSMPTLSRRAGCPVRAKRPHFASGGGSTASSTTSHHHHHHHHHPRGRRDAASSPAFCGPVWRSGRLHRIPLQPSKLPRCVACRMAHGRACDTGPAFAISSPPPRVHALGTTYIHCRHHCCTDINDPGGVPGRRRVGHHAQDRRRLRLEARHYK
eukprot:COSAG01_NODE_7646_length_3115_cov_2.441976_4_plen_210_part_00